ncbi:MmcQ/YjbR family DNA-binding protein [Hasllibacter sp. MH4015]|uniref:MmcQ/YjbR family DNA-binding protein n=1 Tax=Hasllibacter sp. MH4015 TaxID=2854029 RepID=UPI001CD41515|nr:MmcQ/YjbR family DNA-binding protein [Hasllibacter sp. MH4015]
MQEVFVDIYCRGFPGTERTTPFGDDTVVWTVHGHMFAAYTKGGEGVSLRLDNKIAAHLAVGQGRAASTPYLKGDGWVLFPWDTRPEELRDRIGKSYRLVLSDKNR